MRGRGVGLFGLKSQCSEMPRDTRDCVGPTVVSPLFASPPVSKTQRNYQRDLAPPLFPRTYLEPPRWPVGTLEGGARSRVTSASATHAPWCDPRDVVIHHSPPSRSRRMAQRTGSDSRASSARSARTSSACIATPQSVTFSFRILKNSLYASQAPVYARFGLTLDAFEFAKREITLSEGRALSMLFRCAQRRPRDARSLEVQKTAWCRASPF